MTQLLDAEQISELAEDIFYDMAPDNLEPLLLTSFEKKFEDDAFIEVTAPQHDWEPWTEFVPEPELFAEVVIGFFQGKGRTKRVLARMLLSREQNNRFCHVLWPEKR
tara:strand:+ start:159 stop:479 length:321 start_codon:yes stop_codon:yes gene_type:complete